MDIVARIEEGVLVPAGPLPAALVEARDLVAADFEASDGWLNAGPSDLLMNKLPTAKLLPFIFYANGDCAARYNPILGLKVPEWSLVWFAVLLIGAVLFGVRWFIDSRRQT